MSTIAVDCSTEIRWADQYIGSRPSHFLGSEWVVILKTAIVVRMPSPNAVACCFKKRCAVKAQVEAGSTIALVKCTVPGCLKSLHYVCYQGHVIQKNSVEPICVGEEEQIVCSKTCYSKKQKEQERLVAKSSSRQRWDTDAKKGPDDENNSLKIVLDWLMQEGNYSRFRGKDNNGT